jgi:hypothetical protein
VTANLALAGDAVVTEITTAPSNRSMLLTNAGLMGETRWSGTGDVS